jgi:hypothetical protein
MVAQSRHHHLLHLKAHKHRIFFMPRTLCNTTNTTACLCVAGVVPGVKEANKNEPLLPWGRYHQGRVVLGSRVEAACATPGDLQHAAGLYKHEKFVLCFRADTKKVSKWSVVA